MIAPLNSFHHPERIQVTTTADLVNRFHSIITELREKTNASRTTLRLDEDRHGFHVNGVVAEALAPGIKSIAQETSLQQRAAGSATYLEKHRKILVQNDCATAEAQPPKELLQLYGVKAQMLAPIVRGENMVGWISVHYNLSPREWTPEDVAALEAAVAATHKVIDEM
jgi:maleate isomerase